MQSSVHTIRIRTDDADEASERLAHAFGRHDRVPERSGPLGYEFFAVGTRRVTAGTTAVRMGSTVRAATTGPTLHLPLDASAVYRLGRRELRAQAGSAVLLAPGHEYSVRLTAGSWLALRVDSALLSEALAARGRTCAHGWTVDSLAFPLPATAASSIREAIAALRALGKSGAGARSPAVAAAELHVAGWFADLLPDARALRPATAAGARVALSVDRWMRHRIAAPIALGQLADVAGVGERCLQKACLAHWGCSPLERVASHRLAAARRLLLQAAPGASVTRIATECGIAHLGRFAVAYRRTYGESPSETLARGHEGARRLRGARRAQRPAAVLPQRPGDTRSPARLLAG
ncbi:MAG: helix-turn-helix domain-containing protein [Betaproteobacteria bacterium]|nr:helix-turn-helix domain-containing protein [Betaproteobacteria bacterium]